jgi:glycosyltransferase involved in cell wall biosynthesis
METPASTSGVIAAARTSVIIPAFNEEQAIGRVVHALRSAAQWHEILVVDDASSDKTAEFAAAAGAIVVRQPYNKGNGAAVKSGLRRASGEFILVVDADGQHRPADATRLLSYLDRFELVVGARRAATQASWQRRIGNGLLNSLAGYLAGRPIPDLTSGFRAAHRARILEFIHLIPNRFSTPTTTTLAFIKAGYGVTFVPIDAEQRTGASKIRLGRDGAKFMLILLRVTTIFSPLRVFAPLVVVSFSLGVLYALWTLVTQSHVTNSSVLLIVLSVLLLLVGVLSEQIASMRLPPPGVVKSVRRDG